MQLQFATVATRIQYCFQDALQSKQVGLEELDLGNNAFQVSHDALMIPGQFLAA